MGNNKQDYLGRSTVKGKPQKGLKFNLSEQALSKIAAKAREEVTPDLYDLQNQVDSIQIHGLAVSNEFGNDPHIGISQKKLSEEHIERLETETNLQEQINAIVADKAVVNLTATPSTVFVGNEATINLGATTNTEASSIIIKKGSTVIASGSGMSLSGSDTITPSAAGNTTYNAEFVIADLQKAATPKSVAAVHRIYYGAAAANDWESITNYDHTPRTSPSGVTYNVNIATNGQHVFFIIPASMIGNKTVTAKKNGFNFPLKAPVDVTKTDGGVEVAYKVYQDASDVGYTQGTESITLTIN